MVYRYLKEIRLSVNIDMWTAEEMWQKRVWAPHKLSIRKKAGDFQQAIHRCELTVHLEWMATIDWREKTASNKLINHQCT